MSVNTLTRACPRAEWMRGGFPGKGSNLPALYLHTHSFVPLKGEGADRVIPRVDLPTPGWWLVCHLLYPRGSGSGNTNQPAVPEGTGVSESNSALPNFCRLPSRVTPDPHYPDPPLHCHLEEATV